MPVLDSDIVFYGSTLMPDDDVAVNIGGAEDTSIRIIQTDIVATDTVEILSDNAGDTTQTVTIFGRDAGGVLVSEGLSLNGTTVVSSTQIFQRILKITLSATATGTVTIRDTATDTVIEAIEPTVTEIRRPFYDALAEAAGGANRVYVEKIFARNNHATLALTSAVVVELADPSGLVDFLVESVLDGTDTNGAGNNRQVPPAGTFDSLTKNVSNSGNLTAGSAQGIWQSLTLNAGAAANNTSFTVRVSGSSTE